MANLDQIVNVMRSEVNKTISPQCEMYQYTRTRISTEEDTQNYYFETGFELAKNLCDFLIEVGVNPAEADLLDFAAGYGRVTRWLIPVFNSVTVADTEQDMLDFQAQVLGVNGFLSTMDPSSLYDHPDRYDVVFVFSLLTHLPKNIWSQWLSSIFSLVKESGYLIFSTHSYEMIAELDPDWFSHHKQEDHVFWEANETHGRLPTNVYGGNVVTDNFVKKELNKLGNATRVRHYKNGEFDRYHDIYVARKTTDRIRKKKFGHFWSYLVGKTTK